MRRLLLMLGYSNLNIVKSQEEPDGNFPTIKSSNPEEKEALKEGILLAKEVNADILIVEMAAFYKLKNKTLIFRGNRRGEEH